jgi:5'-methylthioadenosine phosphorylase
VDKPVLGIIGGSGLYDMDGLANVRAETLDTPFGAPSGPYRIGELHGARLVFLARHGQDHSLTPSEINYRANIHGFRQLGVRRLVSVSAVGSLREDIQPGHMVLPDQFFDRTKARAASFFGAGAVVHVGFGDPVCPVVVRGLREALEQLGARYHAGGTYVCMEGPVFSTRAESEFYRGIGASVIGMTALPEAKLAREAEMCYATLALSTDYDCWHQTEEHVSADGVVQVLMANIATARRTIEALAGSLPLQGECKCQGALGGALLSAPDRIPAQTRKRLELLLGRFYTA